MLYQSKANWVCIQNLKSTQQDPIQPPKTIMPPLTTTTASDNFFDDAYFDLKSISKRAGTDSEPEGDDQPEEDEIRESTDLDVFMAHLSSA